MRCQPKLWAISRGIRKFIRKGAANIATYLGKMIMYVYVLFL